MDKVELKKYKDLTNIKLPYVKKDQVLFGAGDWNGYHFEYDEVVKSFENTDWSDPKNCALFYDHEDDSMAHYIGQVDNVKIVGSNIVGDIVIVDEDAARKAIFNGGKFGISSKLEGEKLDDNSIVDFVHQNFSLVFEPAAKVAYLKQRKEGNPGKVLLRPLMEDETLKPKEEKKMAETTEKKEEAKLGDALEKLTATLESMDKRIAKLEEEKVKKEEPAKEEKKEEAPAAEEKEEESAEETEEDVSDESEETEETKEAVENMSKRLDAIEKVQKKIALRQSQRNVEPAKTTVNLKEEIMQMEPNEKAKLFIAHLAQLRPSRYVDNPFDAIIKGQGVLRK